MMQKQSFIVVKISENDLRKQQVAGFYRDVELAKPSNDKESDVEKKERELEGTKKTKDEDLLHFVRVSC